MLEVLGDRKVVLAKELTKIHEGFVRDKISNILDADIEYKGEFVVVVEGSSQNENETERETLNNLSLEEHFKFYVSKGLDKKEIIKQISKDRNVTKNEIYQYFL